VVAGLATVTTILLGLDTTAVLLTPSSALASCRMIAVPVLSGWRTRPPAAGLNLTNLLAMRTLHLTPHGFFSRVWLPTISVALTVTISLRYRRPAWDVRRADASGCHRPAVVHPDDAGVSALVPGILLGGDPTIVARSWPVPW
jgi:arsenical pump membrane protein